MRIRESTRGTRVRRTASRWAREIQPCPVEGLEGGVGRRVERNSQPPEPVFLPAWRGAATVPIPGRWIPPADGSGETTAGWRRHARLELADDSVGGVGHSVALGSDGTTGLRGADEAAEPNGPRAGAAYVVERIDGARDQQSRLVPDDGDEKDFFGRPVALAGETALVVTTNGEADVSYAVVSRMCGGR